MQRQSGIEIDGAGQAGFGGARRVSDDPGEMNHCIGTFECPPNQAAVTDITPGQGESPGQVAAQQRGPAEPQAV